MWRQRCSAPDTSVAGDQKISLTEGAAEGDTEADSWTDLEVMAAVGMVVNTADSRAKEGAVQAENPPGVVPPLYSWINSWITLP